MKLEKSTDNLRTQLPSSLPSCGLFCYQLQIVPAQSAPSMSGCHSDASRNCPDVVLNTTQEPWRGTCGSAVGEKVRPLFLKVALVQDVPV